MDEQLSFADSSGSQPLPARLRPQTIDEVVGQQHLLGPGKVLRRIIEQDMVSSMIFWGPPGVGKTTLAHVIANHTKAKFINFSAVTSGIKEIRGVMQQAEENRRFGEKTILFVDEIHRFNKAQQDYLLPFVESGLITLIGATTENPYFEVNKALISRSRVFELKPLSSEDVQKAMCRALATDPAMAGVEIDEDALTFLSDACSGDVRSALNALELGAMTTQPNQDGTVRITLPIAQECIQKRAVLYDKDGDQHYDVISAFIKSMRGSDPQATLYYLARMLAAGEDIKFIARRIMIHACEDVGLADPMALVVATAASLACERVGLPEANLILADAALYVATAPKSNSVCAGIAAAQNIVEETGTLPVPSHLQDAHYKSAAILGRGAGYLYPHDFPKHYVNQQYLPDEIASAWPYAPSRMGYEAVIAERLNNLIRNSQN